MSFEFRVVVREFSFVMTLPPQSTMPASCVPFTPSMALPIPQTSSPSRIPMGFKRELVAGGLSHGACRRDTIATKPEVVLTHLPATAMDRLSLGDALASHDGNYGFTHDREMIA